MSGEYPPFTGPRLPLAEAREGGGPVAGRLESRGGALRLVDGSGGVEVGSVDRSGAGPGDWVSGRLVRLGDGTLRLTQTVVHAPSLGSSPDPDLPGRLPRLALRAEIVAAARAFFRERGFLEVQTPVRVPCPGLEPHLRAFPSGGPSPRWLITSPELHLKRLLAAGAERVVEFARAFRAEEKGPLHRSEFLLLEWYRAFEGLEALARDCEGLVAACAAAAARSGAPAGAADGLEGPFRRLTVREAVQESTGLDLAALRDPAALAAALRRRGHATGPDDGWDDLFFRLWIAEVEPGLGAEPPALVFDWPASQAALARVRPDPEWPVAERFELFARGVELANAFHELNDPVEQRRRHERDRERRLASGAEAYPLDEAFLAALESGMPPSSGIALGLDRLVMLLCGASSLDEVSPFPETAVDPPEADGGH